jgi:cysteine-rich repeat protein
MSHAHRLTRITLVLLLACGAGACGDDDGGQTGNDATVRTDGTTPATCGDGVREGTEACDDGLANSDSEPDACRTSCQLPSCGDGVRDASEACDHGPQNSDIVPDACRSDCAAARCGDQVVDVQGGELCDCGDDPDDLPGTCRAVNGDPYGTCDASCLPVYCGNGAIDIVDPVHDVWEECDDGNLERGDGCDQICRIEG